MHPKAVIAELENEICELVTGFHAQTIVLDRAFEQARKSAFTHEEMLLTTIRQLKMGVPAKDVLTESTRLHMVNLLHVRSIQEEQATNRALQNINLTEIRRLKKLKEKGNEVH